MLHTQLPILVSEGIYINSIHFRKQTHVMLVPVSNIDREEKKGNKEESTKGKTRGNNNSKYLFSIYCARHYCAKHLKHTRLKITPCNPHQNPEKDMLFMTKLKFKEIKCLVQGHTDIKWYG